MHLVYQSIPAEYYKINTAIWKDQQEKGGARGVIVIVVGNELGDTSLNPGRNSLHVT